MGLGLRQTGSEKGDGEISMAIPLSVACPDRVRGHPTIVPSLLDGLCLQNLGPKLALPLLAAPCQVFGGSDQKRSAVCPRESPS